MFDAQSQVHAAVTLAMSAGTAELRPAVRAHLVALWTDLHHGLLHGADSRTRFIGSRA